MAFGGRELEQSPGPPSPHLPARVSSASGRSGGRFYTDKAEDLLRQLVRDFPQVPDYRLDLCETIGRPPRGERRGDPDAETRLRKRLAEAIALSAPLVAEFAGVPDFVAARVRYLGEYGVATFRAGSPDAAVAPLRETLDAETKLVEQCPEVIGYSFWLARIEWYLGRVQLERGELPEAVGKLESAVARLEALRAKDSRLAALRPQLGMVYPDLARALTAAGESSRAEETRRKARDYEADAGEAQKPFGSADRGRPKR